MRKNILTVVSLIALLALVLAPLGSRNQAVAQTLPPDRMPREVAAETLAAFKDGMPVEEFLAQSTGPIPRAVMQVIDTPIAVVVELEQPSLIASMLAAGESPRSMSAAAQRSYADGLLAAQSPLVAEVQARGGTVLGQYTKTYNGILVKAPGKEIAALYKLPGVKAVHRAPLHTVELGASVPLINADDVWAIGPGADGVGVTIAIIDTGIDYTHAAFDGPGTPADFADNDPNVVEAGTFPTAKVIGGYDFAGTDYDASDDTSLPVPDDDPLDENGHGTHVASTAAGLEVVDSVSLGVVPSVSLPVLVGSGVAPGASLYALKVFGAEGSTNVVVNALEWAMDPNGDGDLSDRVDVINMSLGSPWGTASASDPDVVATNMAVALGTVVVASAGNEGDSSYVTGAPAVADKAISVAASTTGFVTLPTVKYGMSSVPYMPGNAFTTAVEAELVDVDDVDGNTQIPNPANPGTFLDHGTGELCVLSQVTDLNALTGKVALIQRGDCSFSTKIGNAATRGAVGAIIYNTAAGGEEFISMLTAPATLPAGFVVRSHGLTLKALPAGTIVTVGPDREVEMLPFGTADQVAGFSSRGPRGFDSKLKPEISAPGVTITAAGMGTGDAGVSMGGTSMAAPHIAGVAALVLANDPSLTPEQVKAAIMNTAVDLDSGDPASYQIVPRTGAGRVDALAAVNTTSLAIGDPDLVSLSWGLVEVGVDVATYVVPEAKLVRLTNNNGGAKTYDVDVTFSKPLVMLGAELVVPATVTVPNGATVGMPVVLELDPNALPLENSVSEFPLNFGVMEEYYGFITFTPQGGGNTVRLPFYFVPRPFATLVEQPGADETMSIFGAGTGTASITFQQTGPKTSNLWAWPALVVDPNEAGVSDEGDIRAIGMDFAFNDPDEGDIIGVAIANYGPIHTLQPYFTETDMYVDVERDGVDDWVMFNHNEGEASGGDPNNDWVVLAIRLADNKMFFGSPYYIGADFNSGIQEWYIYAPTEDRFDYEFVGFDSAGNEDATPRGSFDYNTFPIDWEISNFIPATGENTVLTVSVEDSGNYMLSNVKGVLLLDYYGKPGIGQAHVIQLTVSDLLKNFMPVINK